MNLLQVVIAVALVAMVTVGGIQYASPGAQVRKAFAAGAEGGFGTLEGAYRALQAAGAPPPATADWETALFPAYGYRPVALRGLDWSYGNGADGIWFCLSGPLEEEAVQSALDGLARRYPAAHYEVTAECGGQGGVPSGAPDGRIAASLWMQRSGG